MMEDDILTERRPITDEPRWDRIEARGIGVEIDEAKLRKYDAAFRKHGELPTYAAKTAASK